MEVIEFTKDELQELTPSSNVLTQDATIGMYKYDGKIVGKYNTKYVFKHEADGTLINLVFKNMRGVYIDDKPMIKQLDNADKYKLVETFEVAKADPEPATADKKYPMYAFDGYAEFQKEAGVLQKQSISPTQDMYDTLYATEVNADYSDRYYRKLHVKDNMLVPV